MMGLGALLDAAAKDFPRSPRVVDLRCQLGTDATGDNAVWVWVVLDDATPKSRLRHASFEPIAEQIRAAIRKAHGLPRVAYVRFRLESEQNEVDRIPGAM